MSDTVYTNLCLAHGQLFMSDTVSTKINLAHGLLYLILHIQAGLT